MPRPSVADDTKQRVDEVIEDSVGIRADFLTFNQKVEVLLDKIDEQQNALKNRSHTGGL